MNTTNPAAARPVERPPFGRQLQHFRRLRGMSQLALANAAGASPRHLSFVESGRARPSRDMVLRLAASLDMPLREQNELLGLAGFAPVYPERRLDAPALASVRGIVEQMLKQHEPYPALVLDRYWYIVQVNAAAERLFADLFTPLPIDAIELLFGAGPIREAIENWHEMIWTVLSRLRREAAFAGTDARLNARVARAEQLLEGLAPSPGRSDDAPTLTSRLNLGSRIVATISTLASFNAPRDVTLDELRVELIFPADAEAEAYFRGASERSA